MAASPTLTCPTCGKDVATKLEPYRKRMGGVEVEGMRRVLVKHHCQPSDIATVDRK